MTIHGKADARGSWARYGKRLVHLLVRLLVAHPACIESGEARIELGASSTVLRLDAPQLAQLGANTDSGDDAPPVLMPAACADLRAAGLPAAWRLSLDPEALIYPGGVLVPLALCTRKARRIYILPVAGLDALDRLERAMPHLGGRAELLLAAAPEVVASGRELPAPHIAWPPGEPLDLAGAVGLITANWGKDGPAPVQAEETSAISRLLGRARREGLVPPADVREALGEEPPAGPVAGGRGVEYIPGVGLCSAGFLTRVRELIDDQLEFFAGRLLALPQLTATIALNLPAAAAAGRQALEVLVAALPEYVIVPRKLFDPYVRPLSHVTGTASRAAATAAALGKAA
ncbi:MAG: hypothetical protein ACR2M0_06765 [Chloroflexia bacterium]